MNLDEGFQVQDLRPIVRRRAPLALAVAGVVFLASVVLAAVLPNEYQASAVLLVQPQSVSRAFVEGGVETLDLNQRLSIMEQQILAPARLSELIDEFGLYPEKSKEMTRMEVVLLMRDHIQLEPVVPELEEQARGRNDEVEINTFLIRYTSESPLLAARVANRLAGDFVDKHIEERIAVSEDTREFIDVELTRIQTRLQEVESQIAEVEEANAGRLPSDLATNQRLLERATANLRQLQADLGRAESEVAFYRQQAAQASALRASGRDVPSPQRQLEILDLKLTELEARGLTEKHPDVVAVRQEIAALEERYGEDGDGGAPLKNVAQLSAEAEALRAEARAEALRREISRTTAEIESLEARIAETPRVEERLAALRREYQSLFDKQKDYGSKSVDAEVAANMELRQKGEQVRVLSRAFEPPSPTRPNRPLIMVLGLLLGLALGGGVAVLREGTDSSFHGARQVQTALRLPVLASIPSILLDGDRALRRRRRLVTAAATLVLVGFVLSGATAGYFAVNGAPGWLRGLFASEEASGSAGASPASRG